MATTEERLAALEQTVLAKVAAADTAVDKQLQAAQMSPWTPFIVAAAVAVVAGVAWFIGHVGCS